MCLFGGWEFPQVLGKCCSRGKLTAIYWKTSARPAVRCALCAYRIFKIPLEHEEEGEGRGGAFVERTFFRCGKGVNALSCFHIALGGLLYLDILIQEL